MTQAVSDAVLAFVTQAKEVIQGSLKDTRPLTSNKGRETYSQMLKQTLNAKKEEIENRVNSSTSSHNLDNRFSNQKSSSLYSPTVATGAIAPDVKVETAEAREVDSSMDLDDIFKPNVVKLCDKDNISPKDIPEEKEINQPDNKESSMNSNNTKKNNAGPISVSVPNLSQCSSTSLLDTLTAVLANHANNQANNVNNENNSNLLLANAPTSVSSLVRLAMSSNFPGT